MAKYLSPSVRIKNLADRFIQYTTKYEAEKDQRAYCAFAFHLFHKALASHISQEVLQFADKEWVARLSDVFAKRFFDAMDFIDENVKGKDAGGWNQLPQATEYQPWIDVYTAFGQARTFVTEALVLSLTAHISYDLPRSLYSVGLNTTEGSRVKDFHLINNSLASQIDPVQREIAKRFKGWTKFLDKLGGGFDEIFTNYGLRMSRGLAWYNATRLLDPHSSTEAMESIRSTTGKLVSKLRKPESIGGRFILAIKRLIPGRFKWKTSNEFSGEAYLT